MSIFDMLKKKPKNLPHVQNDKIENTKTIVGNLIEDKHYYNNSYEISEDMLSIDRVYTVDESRFEQSDYDKLDEIYQSIPGFKGYNSCACWYGTEDDYEWLWVSFEPSGLQFCGNLKAKDFEVWETALHYALSISSLPFK